MTNPNDFLRFKYVDCKDALRAVKARGSCQPLGIFGVDDAGGADADGRGLHWCALRPWSLSGSQRLGYICTEWTGRR